MYVCVLKRFADDFDDAKSHFKSFLLLLSDPSSLLIGTNSVTGLDYFRMALLKIVLLQNQPKYVANFWDYLFQFL